MVNQSKLISLYLVMVLWNSVEIELCPDWPFVVEKLQDSVFVFVIFVVRVLVQVAVGLLLVLIVVVAVVEFEVVAVDKTNYFVELIV